MNNIVNIEVADFEAEFINYDEIMYRNSLYTSGSTSGCRRVYHNNVNIIKIDDPHRYKSKENLGLQCKAEFEFYTKTLKDEDKKYFAELYAYGKQKILNM